MRALAILFSCLFFAYYHNVEILSLLPYKKVNQTCTTVDGNQVCYESHNVNYAKKSNKDDVLSCNEEIFFFSKLQSDYLIKTLLFFIQHTIVSLPLLANTLGEHYENPTSFQAKYGVRAVKICATCQDFLGSIPADQQDSFEQFCGRSVYGYNETMTGTLLLPIEDDGYLKSGELNGAIWMHGFDLEGMGQSEKLPRSMVSFMKSGLNAAMSTVLFGLNYARTSAPEVKVMFQNQGAIMLASRGVATIIPDYLGYGDDKKLIKGNFVKQSYQTASIPLYLLAQRVIKSTSASSYLGTRTFVAGFSEGGFGSVAVAEAVSSLGLETYLLTGGLPNLDTIQDKMIGFFRVMTGNFPFLGFYAMMNSGYISSPHNDIMFPHGFFSELGEKELSQAVNSDRSVQEIKVEVEKGFKLKGPGCFEKGINCPDYLNPLLVSQFMNVSTHDPITNPEYLPCKSQNPSPDIQALCIELEKYNVQHMLSQATFPVDICHYPGDLITPFHKNVYDKLTNDNKLVKLDPSQEAWELEEKQGRTYDHATSGIVCLLISTLKILRVVEN